MKYLKITVLVFIGTLIISSINIFAKIYTFAQVNVPALSITVDAATSTKENTSDQTFQKITCRDTLSNDERAVEVRTYSLTLDRANYWVSVPKGKIVNISNGLHDEPGQYTLQARTTSSKATGCEFSGTWNLD